MNAPRVPPRFVPTLTEVVEFEEAQVLDEPMVGRVAPVAPGVPVALNRAFTSAPAPQDWPQQAAVVVHDVTYDIANDIKTWQADALTPSPVPMVEPDLRAVAALVGEVREVDELDEVRAPALASTSTEDVPAYLLATQPMPVPKVVDAEPDVAAAVVAAAAPSGALDTAFEALIVQSVLTELQQRTDLMLEYRLRESLTPILARLCDALIKEARQDLAVTLRDVVSRAVAQELARHRPK